ncbi:Cytochrome P450 6a2 [Cryptotermes secundus]|uniref:Cytochrome P450 6a2 n=1 Tax=Cryptotermes secundus TaxID=105785 RepID=A0A2J7PVE5_9NEOP|nr:Cytochrome P450 6a2 [Cryptotermes secundus]
MGLLFETSPVEWLTMAIILFTSVWYYFKSEYSFWKKKGVRFISPVIPFGNIKDMILLRKATGEMLKVLYDEFPEEPFVGTYELTKPMLIIRDPELIKRVTVKDFSYFQDRGVPVNEELEPLGSHLLNLTGKKWRTLRSKLTPTFTSGKIKMMFHLMIECAEQLKDYLEKPAQNGEILEMKEAVAKYSTNVIGLCAFGLQFNAINESDSEFRRIGRRVFETSVIAAELRMLQSAYPSAMKIFPMKIVPDEVNKHVIRTVKEVMEYREKNNVSRNDFMQLLIELKNKGRVHDDEPVKSEDKLDRTSHKETETNVDFTETLLASQAFIFFLAGFETSSTTLSFCLHELALNPEVQERLREEIDSTLEKYEGKITYDAIHSMSYLDKVVDETLRKYPPLPSLFRAVTKPYVIPGTSVRLHVGMKVMIPVCGLHYDPQYFPEPEIFNPENFSDDSRARRPHNAYLPFGDGPRNCIGMRFGLLQAKLGLCVLLSNFKFSVCDKTQLPIKLDPKIMVMASESGIWLRINKRDM